MRLTVATRAVVLRSWPYGESDKIVCLLTENHGKVTGIAKGAKRSRKRFANSLEPFSLVSLRFQDRPQGGLVFILSADLIVTFKNLGSSLEKITLASYLVEITGGLIGERDENSLVFQHLKNGLLFLDNDGTSPLEFLASFELELLRLSGYQPVLDSCKRCSLNCRNHSRLRWHFSPAEGGILCDQCAPSNQEILPLGTATLAALANLQEKNLVEKFDGLGGGPLPAPVLKEVRFITQRFLQYHMDREIKSAPFLAMFVAV
ncbi:MAG: DNA repair protein RecO [Deltaproteobacteria bacterium]|nr:DNA repair protein RecO [Deltaproteobacteria bacterium]